MVVGARARKFLLCFEVVIVPEVAPHARAVIAAWDSVFSTRLPKRFVLFVRIWRWIVVIFSQ